jgi:NitT/TauT family transport system ATP-binding protein
MSLGRTVTIFAVLWLSIITLLRTALDLHLTDLSPFFATHDIEESVQLADRVIVMTSRPAGIKAEMPVLLPRLRDLDAPEYLKLRDQIFERLGMSLKVGASA